MVEYARRWYSKGNVRNASSSARVSPAIDSTRVTLAMNNSDAIPSPSHSISASRPGAPARNDSKSCNGHDAATSLHDSAPNDPSNTGNPSSVKKYGTSSNGCGCKSTRENLTAVSACAAERMLTTMWEGQWGCADLREVAMREGMRREKATSG